MRKESTKPYLARLTQAVRKHQLDRRGFMVGAVATGMTVALASNLYSKAAKAAPQRGGAFRIGVEDGNTTDQLDPATTVSQFMIQMNHTCRNYLTEITEDNAIGPDAAASWEASDDATTWTFKIRNGVEFHNGKTFTAQDALASLNYHRGEDSKSAAKALVDPIKDIKTDGDDTLVVTLEAGAADFPYVLSDYHLVMMPSDGDGQPDQKSGIGTGAYVLKEFEPGVSAELHRNPNYFKEGKGNFDSVVYTAINDTNSRQTALVSDDVDAITEPDLKTVHLLGRDPNIEVDDVKSGAYGSIPMFMDVAPFDNEHVRHALKYGINRQEILEKILHGYGTIGNDHPIGPSLPYWTELPQREYDPEKAKYHMEKSGLGTLNINLSAADAAFPGAIDAAILYKEHVAPAGININVVREPNDGYWSNVWLKKPFCMVSWGARPTPDLMFSLAYAAEAAWNDSHYKGERFNQLLVEARAELDDNKRTEIYAEMMQIHRDEGGTIVPFFRNRVYARRKNVMHGDNLTGNWPLDGGRAAERWWFA